MAAKRKQGKERQGTERQGKDGKDGKKTRRVVSSSSTAPGGQTEKPASRPRVPFPRKANPPTETEFLARLPLAAGKKFEAVRAFMKKQKGVAEDLYFYGPRTGWAYRYVRGSHSLATIMIHDERLMGILSLEAAVLSDVDFESLSPVCQHAREMAHGSPSLLWLDLPLDGSGAADFRTLLRAKLKALPAAVPPPPSPPPPPPESAAVARSQRRLPPPPPPPRSKALPS